jgi:hypothetical protein
MHSSSSALVLFSTLLFAAPLAAQNPWAVVPAFPTTCYTEGDPFPAQIEAAFEANQDALGRQEQINEKLHDQQVDLDDGVASSRMIAYQQKNPAGFQKYMEYMARDPQAEQTASENHDLRMSRFQEEFDTLLANYDAALKSTLDPVRTRMAKVTDPSSGASNAEMAAAVAEYNSTYEALCTKWIIRQDFPGFLTKYKAYLVGNYLPSLNSQTAMDKTTFEMSGISAKDYQSTEPFSVASQYIDYARTAYGLRWRTPQGL